MPPTDDRVDLLAIAAHRDDCELTCGGTLARAVRQGHRVGILDLTQGEMGTRGSAELRAEEAMRALAGEGVVAGETGAAFIERVTHSGTGVAGTSPMGRPRLSTSRGRKVVSSSNKSRSAW